ncbi:MAG: tetratricopeptide repeat protein [Candidatus Eremiobacteraeota bacterium]|nr:tetratricopeptide repeat protein [Candidatus Eremiobacteraeota bacterium]MCW5870799.1 tetratricopeptide repeat protein [Candidatus Eremiobacteraeota bacterium]
MESLTSAQQALGSYSFELCLQWLKHAMPDCQADPVKRCLLLNNLGLYHRKNGNPEKAARFFEQALQDCQPSWLRGRIFANWGVLEHRRGNLVAARRLYQDALNCCSQPVEDEKAVVRLCINFARLHVQQDRGVQADTLLRRARGLVAKYPDDAMLECRYHLAMGRAAMAGRRLAKAEVDFVQAIRVVQKLDYFEPVLLAQCRSELANCYSLQAFGQLDVSETKKDGLERGDQAENLFCEALELLEGAEQSQSLEYIEALSLAMDHSVRTGQWENAETRVQKLLERVTATEHLEIGIRISAWERATLILRQVGKPQLAERAQRRQTALLKQQREKGPQPSETSPVQEPPLAEPPTPEPEPPGAAGPRTPVLRKVRATPAAVPGESPPRARLPRKPQP